MAMESVSQPECALAIPDSGARFAARLPQISSSNVGALLVGWWVESLQLCCWWVPRSEQPSFGDVTQLKRRTLICSQRWRPRATEPIGERCRTGSDSGNPPCTAATYCLRMHRSDYRAGCELRTREPTSRYCECGSIGASPVKMRLGQSTNTGKRRNTRNTRKRMWKWL